jgi:two-component system, sensor histidine kinase
MEYRVFHHSGVYRWIQDDGSPRYNSKGEFIGFIGHCLDVSERKRSEELVKLEEARLESLLKINQFSTESIQLLLDFALDEAITLTLSKIGYIYLYDEAKEVFTLNTWSKEVMPQCKVAEPRTVYHLDKTGIWGEAVRQRKTIMLNNFGMENPLKKGIPQGHVPLEKFLTIPVFSENEIVAVVGVANKTDDYNDSDVRQLKLMMDAVWKIVQRKNAEEALKEKEDRFRTLFTQMTEGFALHEVVYNENHKAIDYRILEINPAFERNVGVPFDKAIGALATDLYGVSSAPFLEQYAQVAETGKPCSFQTYFPPLDRHFDISVFSPKLGRFATVFTDITDRKKAVDALEESEARLKEMNTTKDKFFSIIAHDLRSPFNLFLGYTEVMVDELENMSLREIQGLAINMKKSANNLYDLLENLLQWSQIQRGIFGFEPETFQIKTLIDDCIEPIIETANKKGVEISSTLPTGLTVFADMNMLKSVIRNLTANAVKFTPKGGRIKIEAITDFDQYVRIAVEDTGIGMNNEILGKLFQINEHTSRKGTEGEPSSGLGLIICKDFVDKNKGTIWAESKEGEGSTFYFTLPIGYN